MEWMLKALPLYPLFVALLPVEKAAITRNMK
jgi:hypothetical protein